MDLAGWTAICAIVTLLVAFGGVVVRLIDRINKSEAKAESAATAAIEVASNKLEIERVKADLVEHRVAVAEKYVSKEALRDSESRILSAIAHLSERIDALFRQRPAE